MSRALPLDLLDLKVSPIPDAMSSPPTVTRGANGAASTINGAATTAAAIQPSNTKLIWAHGTVAPRSAYPTNFYEPNTINSGGGTRGANYYSLRFMTDAPEFDFAVRESGGDFMLWVDGQPASRTLDYPLRNEGATVYYKVSFGADALTYQVESVTVAAGGSGYATGDVVTLAGGTGTAAQVLVASVSSGAITLGKLVDPGSYSVVPASPVAQDTTTGTGTGATFTPVWGQRHTSRKWRRVEIILRGGVAFGGINVIAGCTVLPWPVSGEKWLFVGDSFAESTFSLTPATTWDEIAAQSLGVFDASVSYGIGAVGYVTVSGSRPNFLGMVPDLISLAPTRVVVGLGINDVSQTSAAIQANVASAYAQLAAQLPNCLFFCLGPWAGKSSTAASTALVRDAVKSGFESVVPANRGVFCDVVTDGLIQPDGTAAPSAPGTGNTGQYTASDGTHPSSSGHVYLGYGVASAVVRGSRTILASA